MVAFLLPGFMVLEALEAEDFLDALDATDLAIGRGVLKGFGFLLNVGGGVGLVDMDESSSMSDGSGM